jgi:valyl-tRNA synthetase
MSKSLGNGIDPLDVVERFGADALRFTVLSAAAVGTDIRLDHEDLDEAFAPGRNFANKVWNAGRFTLMSLGEGPVKSLEAVDGDLELADRWILSRMDRTVEDVTRGLERFRLHDVCEDLRRFFWGDLADWYLELVKGRLRGDDGEASRQAARATLVTVLDQALRLLHPVIPFVTSALWDRLPWPAGEVRPDDLIVAPWPDPPAAWRDPTAEARLAALQELITAVRSLRKEYGIGEGEGVHLQVVASDEAVLAALEGRRATLDRLARVTELSFEAPAPGAIGAHAVLKAGAELFLPLEGVVDLDHERRRLRGELERIEGQLEGAAKKLANEQFVSRAPAEVVERERDKATSLEEQREKLGEKLARFEGGA